jgi:hypothetical protein
MEMGSIYSFLRVVTTNLTSNLGIRILVVVWEMDYSHMLLLEIDVWHVIDVLKLSLYNLGTYT